MDSPPDMKHSSELWMNNSSSDTFDDSLRGGSSSSRRYGSSAQRDMTDDYSKVCSYSIHCETLHVCILL
jgi:hypothetical protein